LAFWFFNATLAPVQKKC